MIFFYLLFIYEGQVSVYEPNLYLSKNGICVKLATNKQVALHLIAYTLFKIFKINNYV